MKRVILTFFALSTAVMEGEVARLYLELGHSESIASVAFSPDGRWAITGSADHSARVWDVATGHEIRRLEGHSGRVSCVAFSPDGRRVITGGADHAARIWEVATGREIRRLDGHKADVNSVAFSLDGSLVFTGSSSDHTARVWEADTGREIRRVVIDGRPAAFSADGRQVLAGEDNIAPLWDVATGKEIRRLEGHANEVVSAALSPDGRLALTGSMDHTARIWDIATGKEIRRLEGNAFWVFFVAFSPDGRRVVTSDDRSVLVWDVGTGKELQRLSPDGMNAAFSPDGRLLLTGGAPTAQLWDLETGKEIRRLEGHSSRVESVAFSPDQRWLLTGSDDKIARLWDLSTGQQVRNLTGHSDAVHSVAFSRDGASAITGSTDTRVWEVATGKEIRELDGGVMSAVFSPDGKLAVTGGWDGFAHIWELATGKELRRLEGRIATRDTASAPGMPYNVRVRRSVRSVNRDTREPFTSASFSPDGRWVLTGSATATARIWDWASGQQVQVLDGHSKSWVTAVAFSPDGRLALTGNGGVAARIWEVATGKEIQRMEGQPDLITTAVFSPDGRWVLTGGHDRTARLWEVTTGKEARRLEGHLDGIESAAFSPDGRRAATGSLDGTTRLWDTASGKWMATLVSFREGGWAVVDADGRYDASDPDNAPGLYFVVAGDVIELEQLKQRFYTPGLLARIWRGERLPEISGSLNDVKLVPAVEVRPPAPSSLEATVRLTNRGGGIGKVIVKVNGRELASATRGAAPDSAAKSAELKLNLGGATLSPTGKNVIEVFAENGDGVIRSRGVIAAWEREPAGQTPPPKLFAIVVGVSSYDNPSLNLRYSAKDAVDFGHALELAARGLFGKERTKVTVLASGEGDEPTKENIRRAFESVARVALGSDLLVVYFAGHGAAASNERDQYYYFTKEARSAEIDRDPALRAVSAVSSGELKQWLAQTNMPLKQVVVLDTCAAGAAFGEMVKLADRRDLSPDQVRAIQLLKDSTGSWILMGSAADAVSYEASRYAQGLLTYALLEGMQGAALQEDRVEVGRLFDFAQRQVQDLARGIGGLQRPVLSAPKGQTFPIGLLKAEDRKQIRLATLKPQLLRARVLDENDLDSLKLEPALRAQLRAASVPVTRGSDWQEPQVVYLDSVVDEVPDALIPQVRYSLARGQLNVRLRLLRNGKPVAERVLVLPGGDAEQLSRALLPVIVAESGKVK